MVLLTETGRDGTPICYVDNYDVGHFANYFCVADISFLGGGVPFRITTGMTSGDVILLAGGSYNKLIWVYPLNSSLFTSSKFPRSLTGCHVRMSHK